MWRFAVAFLVCGLAACNQIFGIPDVTEGAAPSDGGSSHPELDLELVAGNIGGPGHADGAGAEARFSAPQSIAVDSAGNIYVADTGSYTVRRVTPTGAVTTIAGAAGIPGSANGSSSAARFQSLVGVGVDQSGNVYVGDGNDYTIRKISPGGQVTVLAGASGMRGSANGSGGGARFDSPTGIAVDGAGNVYVTDSGDGTIRAVTPAGTVTTLAGTAGMHGTADGVGPDAQFNIPAGVAVDRAGDLYVTDTCAVRRITPAGTVTTLAGSVLQEGFVDGTGSAARFSSLGAISTDSAGNIYVTDDETIRKITPTGTVTTLLGAFGAPGSSDGTGTAARFVGPAGVAVDSSGILYVADSASDTIRKVSSSLVVTTLAGAASAPGSVDGVGIAASFSGPSGLAVDGAGDIYVADQNNNTIRKITNGVVATLAGIPGPGGSNNGSSASATFSAPLSVAVDSIGNTYVADQHNAVIRKITPDGIVATFAGTAGQTGTTDDVGAAARFTAPSGLTIDRTDNLYVTDGNAIRKVGPDGAVSTLAGNPQFSGITDGTGPTARFFNPIGIAVDHDGNVYVADSGNHTIRKVTPAGAASTLAGAAHTAGSADGTGSSARFNTPSDVALDGAGNLFVTDHGNATIRKITPAGVVTTVAGIAGVAGITLGTMPRFGLPRALAISGDSLIISDTNAILVLHHGAD